MAWAIGDATPDPESNSATTTVLDAEIEILIAAKDTVEITPVKVAFELTIIVLTFVRVRVPVLFPFSALTYRDVTRTRCQTTIHSWN